MNSLKYPFSYTKSMSEESDAPHEEILLLKKRIKEQERQIKSLNSRMETRTKREKMFMKALGINNRTKTDEVLPVAQATRSLLALEETFIDMQKKIGGVLKALKTHRESIVRLNKRVYREDSRNSIQMELQIMRNTLAIMAMNGMAYNPEIIDDIEEVEEMLDSKKDLAKIKKKKAVLDRRYRRELERYDIHKIHEEKAHLPGYR